MRLLVKMGWRPGQGVGPRQSSQEKTQWKKQQKQKKVYGCALPGQEETPLEEDNESEEELNDLDPEVTFAPDDFDSYIVKPKDDCFGLGYSGLDRRPVLATHLELFGPADSSSLVLKEKKKKVNIRGQAFGVGAFEEEDGDIYATEDMSQYDFALDTPQMLAEKRKKQRNTKLALPSSSHDTLEGFVVSSTLVIRKQYPPPALPPGFIPRHQQKQSRFNSVTTPIAVKTPTPQLSAAERAAILNSGQETEKPKIPEVKTAVTNIRTFRPFVADPDKQERYEKFLTFSRSDQADKLKSLQPLSMTEWERERERVEFDQAAKMYRPLNAVFGDRFVTASLPDDSTDPLVPVARTASADDDLKNAARLKMFGHLTRRVSEWEPHSILCKRFNIPQPGRTTKSSMKNKSNRPKFSIFNFLDAAANALNFSEGNDTLCKSEQIIAPDSPLVTATAMSSSTINLTASSTINPEHNEVVKDKMEVETAKDDSVEELTDATNKIDLFKAIFLSSSDESDQEESSVMKENMRKEITAAEQNTLRNTSPPRGIFANLNFDTLNSKETKPAMPQEKLADETNANKKSSSPRGSFFSNLIFDVSNSSDALKSEKKKTSESGEACPNKIEDTSLTPLSDDMVLYGPALPNASASSAVDKDKLASKKKISEGVFANRHFEAISSDQTKTEIPQEKPPNKNIANQNSPPSRGSFFANLTFDVSNSSVASKFETKQVISSPALPDSISMYGPALPIASHKLHKAIASKVESSDSEEDWVELNGSSDSCSESNKQSHQKKKQKKHSHRKSKKHKEKKHKHKKKKK